MAGKVDVALYLAGLGWKVLPCFVAKDGAKIPLLGNNWAGKASSNPEKVMEYWSVKPWSSVGILGGKKSGVLIIDCDGAAGIEAMEKLSLDLDIDPLSDGAWVYSTPGKSGGCHILYSWPAGLDDFNILCPVRELEFRGAGHWTAFYGCTRGDLPRGAEYSWLSGNKNEAPGGAPASLVAYLNREAPLAGSGGNGGNGGGLIELSPEEAWRVGGWSDGRKAALAGLLWYVCIRGCSMEEALSWGLRFSEECCYPPLPVGLVERKAEYSWERADRKRSELNVNYLDWLKNK